MTTVDPSTPPRRKRPRSVTLFALAVLYLGAVNLIRAWLVWSSPSYERTLALRMPLTYLAVAGLAWGSVFVISAFGVWNKWPWARKVLLGAIIVYQVHIWINHLIFDTSFYSRQVWRFDSGISVAWVAFVWGFLSLPGIRRIYQPE